MISIEKITDVHKLFIAYSGLLLMVVVFCCTLLVVNQEDKLKLQTNSNQIAYIPTKTQNTIVNSSQGSIQGASDVKTIDQPYLFSETVEFYPNSLMYNLNLNESFKINDPIILQGYAPKDCLNTSCKVSLLKQSSCYNATCLSTKSTDLIKDQYNSWKFELKTGLAGGNYSLVISNALGDEQLQAVNFSVK